MYTADNPLSLFLTAVVIVFTAAFLYQPKKAVLRVATTAQDLLSRIMYGKEKVSSALNFYDLVDKNMTGEEVSMSSFKGQVLLLVNVASQ